jgi:hypothetical protein
MLPIQAQRSRVIAYLKHTSNLWHRFETQVTKPIPTWKLHLSKIFAPRDSSTYQCNT